MQDEGHAEPVGDAAGGVGVVRGLGSQTVVDVVGRDMQTGVQSEHEQRGRIHPARERARGVRTGRERAPGDQVVETVTGAVGIRACSHRSSPP